MNYIYINKIHNINKLYKVYKNYNITESNYNIINFLINELKSKINSYKQQDKKKDYHEIINLITLDDVMNKLINSKLKCYYCQENLLILFTKVRENNQWTLDRLNNYDEHTNCNTIITCLKCNLQRRRKNSEKFRFSKQLENNIIKINKIM